MQREYGKKWKTSEVVLQSQTSEVAVDNVNDVTLNVLRKRIKDCLRMFVFTAVAPTCFTHGNQMYKIKKRTKTKTNNKKKTLSSEGY